MLRLETFEEIYVYRDSVDFRKSINGLSQIVVEEMEMEMEMELDVFGSHLFVFTNRHRNRLKILYWDRNGFCLWQKRLEKDRYRWMGTEEATITEIEADELRRLLTGLDIFQKPHKKLQYKSIR